MSTSRKTLNDEIKAARKAEHAARLAACRTALEAYWAGSVSSSVLADAAAGRTTVIIVK